jgi:hypothetical protein
MGGTWVFPRPMFFQSVMPVKSSSPAMISLVSAMFTDWVWMCCTRVCVWYVGRGRGGESMRA